MNSLQRFDLWFFWVTDLNSDKHFSVENMEQLLFFDKTGRGSFPRPRNAANDCFSGKS